MLDYKLLDALAAVVEQGGFERGARALGLTQSAVSQRVKLLEARLGQPVLLRGSPPGPTAVGRRLLNHVQQVRLLEHDLGTQVPSLGETGAHRLRVALNADSLATWWAEAVAPFCEAGRVLLELVIEDQDVGLKRMRAGDVAGCVCAEPTPVAGAASVALGAMRYLGVASPAFVARHFEGGVTAERLYHAPAVIFGSDDRLQHRFAARLGVADGFVHHTVPSSEGFVRMLESGLGWGLVPALQIRQALERGALVEICPGEAVDVPLYWHYWRQGGVLIDELTARLTHGASRHLV
ncbi:LysR family transcriptional regulator ArgP [Halomonas sp. HNIBRBA4712]|uniref:LysR family transcriptional regulator ArgP n=1 Tax=Halomonas sp. HNIBRBA4712 TaxID=3373087 RepID=UPI0037463E0F